MINKKELNTWKVNIFNSIRDISDIEQQKLSWLGNHPIYESSFSETINILYDDYDFEYFINYLKENEKDEKLYSKMVTLDKKISKYIQYERIDLEVLDDPKWKDITKIANEIIILWITN